MDGVPHYGQFSMGESFMENMEVVKRHQFNFDYVNEFPMH